MRTRGEWPLQQRFSNLLLSRQHLTFRGSEQSSEVCEVYCFKKKKKKSAVKEVENYFKNNIFKS